jgi:hypothetical protein
MEKGLKSGRKLVWIWTYVHANKNSSEDNICFKNDFILRNTKIQKHNYTLLWTTIVYGFTRMCVEPSSLGYSLDCFWNIGLIVSQCVVNQSRSYWLLSNLFATTISLIINM